tara:strand:+ start:1911 stop:2960 length:1050 start_codon:yes stop_codon:yes gene_type:complete
MISKAKFPFRNTLRKFYIHYSIRRCWGPDYIDLKSDEAAVTCLFKNGEHYLESVVRHHTEMGFKHIFLLDNHSTDDSEKIAKKYSNVSYFKTGLPINKYQHQIVNDFANRTVRNGWCLNIDFDELFDYPYSERMGLDRFIAYLNSHNYTAVVTQMLDMFACESLANLASNSREDITTKYTSYDTSAITRVAYSRSKLYKKFSNKSTISNNDIPLLFGGIRKKLYNLDCLLTKNSFFRVEGNKSALSHCHFAQNVNLADISCILLHYKFTSSSMQIAIHMSKTFGNLSGYQDFIKLIEENPDLKISKCPKKYMGAIKLVEEDFLTVTKQFTDYVNAIDSSKSASPILKIN